MCEIVVWNFCLAFTYPIVPPALFRVRLSLYLIAHKLIPPPLYLLLIIQCLASAKECAAGEGESRGAPLIVPPPLTLIPRHIHLSLVLFVFQHRAEDVGGVGIASILRGISVCLPGQILITPVFTSPAALIIFPSSPQ